MSVATNTYQPRYRRLYPVGQRLVRVERRLAALVVPSWVIFVAAAALGVWALAAYWRAGFLLIQGDSIARLNIARGVTDSLTPSFAQLGGIWLPLPQLLMLLTTWIEPMWRTGLSGSIVSIVAFALAVVYVHRTVYALTRNGLAALLGAALLATNPNLLFMQATPMSESLTIFLLLGATYHLLRWLQSNVLLHLLAGAAFVFCATLTRYESWILLPAGGLVIMLAAYRRYRNWRYVEAIAIGWGLLAAYGIFLWLLYGQIIFGDMLNFAHGAGSGSYHAQLENGGLHLSLSTRTAAAVLTYGWSTVDNLGLPLAVAGVLGALTLLLSRLPLAIRGAALLPSSLFVFEVVSLALGQSVLSMPNTAPHVFLNARYGLLMLPGLVIAACWLARSFRSLGLVALALVVLVQLPAVTGPLRSKAVLEQRSMGHASSEVAAGWAKENVPFLRGDQPVALVDAFVDEQIRAKNRQEAGTWMHEHAGHGAILASALGNSRFMFDANLPLHRFVTQGNQPLFDEALRLPAICCRWIVYQPKEVIDPLHTVLRDGLPPRYQVAFENDDFRILERMPAGAAQIQTP